MKTIISLCVAFLLLAFGSIAVASTVGNNDWEGSVDSDYNNEQNWLIAAGTNPAAGFAGDRNYADYTRWILNYRPGDTVVGAIVNPCTIDDTFLMQRTRVMGNTTVTVANGGVYDAWSFQIGSYGGPGQLDVEAGGLVTIDVVETCYVGNFWNNGDGDGVLNIDGDFLMDGGNLTLGGGGSTGQINIGSTGVFSLTNGGLGINGSSGVYMAVGAQYIRSGDWTGNDLLTMSGYSFDPGVSIDYDYDGAKTTMTVVPETITAPSPANGARGVNPAGLTLRWTTLDGGPYKYDVYLSVPPDSNPVLVSGNQDPNSYTPSPELDYGKTYCWRVDVKNEGGTLLVTGPVWTFATGSACNPPLLADTNGDCIVDMRDFAQLALEWLQCTRWMSADCP